MIKSMQVPLQSFLGGVGVGEGVGGAGRRMPGFVGAFEQCKKLNEWGTGRNQ